MQNLRESLGMIGVLAIVALTMLLAGVPASAQTETVLYNFNLSEGPKNPWLGLVFDAAGNLYGTTEFGGPENLGGVFELTRQAGGSWEEKVLHSFGESNAGGFTPIGGLVFDAAGNLYGLTDYGGTNDVGVAYELVRSPSGGWTEKVIHNFGGTGDGREPRASLVFYGGNLYGVTDNSAPTGNGAVFELVPQGDGNWSENVVYTFGSGTDGQNPEAAVVFDSAGNLYGATERGGLYGGGTVFELSPSSGGWTTAA
jgi:uncharacterized repeat protein (TIGR03803 family)